MIDYEKFEFYYNSLLKERTHFILDKNGNYFSELGEKALCLIPGSFNPLHKTHEFIYCNSGKYSNTSGNKFFAYEVSIIRRGKTNYTCEELYKLIQQFQYKGNVMITNAEYFYEKIFALKSTKKDRKIEFHIGIDSYIRLLNDNLPKQVGIYDANFIVYGPRAIGLKSLNFETLENLLEDLIYKVKNYKYYNVIPKELQTISSTNIREKLIT